MPRLDDAPRTALSTTVYRVVQRGVDPLSSRGSERNGGRYNLPGTQGVLYASFEKVTAVAEVAKALKARGINPEDYAASDWWAYELEFSSSRLLDLTDPKVLERLEVSAAALLAGDLTRTRQIGKQALAAGYEGMIVPSAAQQGQKNLVIFLSVAPRFPAVKASTPVDFSQENTSLS